MTTSATPKAVHAAARRLAAAGEALRDLNTDNVDYDDARAERAYYAQAHQVIDLIIATPASSVAGLKVKALAVAWCCASLTDFGLGETRGEQLIASLLRDLLAIIA